MSRMSVTNYRRPARSPLVSMGPSLDEARRRNRHARLIAAGGVALVAALLVVVWLVSLVRHEVFDDTTTGTASAATSAPVLPVGPQ